MREDALSRDEIESLSARPRTDASPETNADHGLRLLPETLARRLTMSMSEACQTPTDVTFLRLERLSCEAFARRCQPADFVLWQGSPGAVEATGMQVERPILFAIFNRLLGSGLDEVPVPDRPLTDIENRLAGRWAELVVHDLQATLGEDLPSVVPERSVNEPTARLPPAAAKELAACSEFQVKVGQTSGVLRLAVPWAVFERASRSLAESPQRAFRTRDPNATVDVSVTLAQTAVPAHEVADLQVGDVIATETAVGDLFEVTIDGQPAFRARVGSSDGRKAVKIEEVIEPE